MNKVMWAQVRIYLWDDVYATWRSPHGNVSMLTALAIIEEWKVTKKNFIVCMAKSERQNARAADYFDFSKMVWVDEDNEYNRFMMCGEVSNTPLEWGKNLIWKYTKDEGEDDE